MDLKKRPSCETPSSLHTQMVNQSGSVGDEPGHAIGRRIGNLTMSPDVLKFAETRFTTINFAVHVLIAALCFEFVCMTLASALNKYSDHKAGVASAMFFAGITAGLSAAIGYAIVMSLVYVIRYCRTVKWMCETHPIFIYSGASFVLAFVLTPTVIAFSK